MALGREWLVGMCRQRCRCFAVRRCCRRPRVNVHHRYKRGVDHCGRTPTLRRRSHRASQRVVRSVNDVSLRRCSRVRYPRNPSPRSTRSSLVPNAVLPNTANHRRRAGETPTKKAHHAGAYFPKQLLQQHVRWARRSPTVRNPLLLAFLRARVCERHRWQQGGDHQHRSHKRQAAGR